MRKLYVSIFMSAILIFSILTLDWVYGKESIGESTKNDSGSDVFTPGSEKTDYFDANDDFDIDNPEDIEGMIKFEHELDLLGSLAHVDSELARAINIPEADLVKLRAAAVKIEELGYTLSFQQTTYEQIIIRKGEINSDEFVHQHKWGRSIESETNSPLSTLFSASGGPVSGSGGAKVKIDKNENTGEYFLITDVENTQGSFPWTSTATFPHQTRAQNTPGKSLFAGDQSFPLGIPTEVDGRKVLKGERDLSLEAGAVIPFVRNYIRWEIWLEPPNNN